LTRSLWPYFIAGSAVGACWLLWLKEVVTSFGPLIRVALTSVIAAVLYVVLVAVLQRSFESVRAVLSLLPHIFSRERT